MKREEKEKIKKEGIQKRCERRYKEEEGRKDS